MTELQWLIKMLTSQKLSPSLKDMFIERIGEVESLISAKPIIIPRPSIQMPQTSFQAPSMQRILDQDTQVAPPKIIVPTEIVTSKGNGTSTRGPRKF